MRIVIDIPEDVYTRLFDNGIQDNEIATDDVCEMARALRLGTPLPKGHGRLIECERLQEVFRRNVVGYAGFKQLFDNAPTIIGRDDS